MRQIMWRVRVKRAVDTWVDVEAHTAADAERAAAELPGIVSVFGRSAIRGDEANRPEKPAGASE